MASSKKPHQQNSAFLKHQAISSSDLSAHPLSVQLNQFLTHQLQTRRSKPNLLLALSGGLDSMVLLHLLAAASAKLPFQLHAMHVHHGLSPNADSWAEFCQLQCQQLNVPLQVVHVQLNINNGLGVEAEARALRYQALFAAQNIDFVMTAHHQDDQAETLLLQLFRGAGVKGLASMAAVDTGRNLLRPLLNVPRQTLQDYAVQHEITWCEDESNDNTQYDRNFVRHALMPVLEARFEGVKTVLARTASHMAEANDLLETLAAQDAEAVLEDNTLCLEGLAKLSLPRIKNLLRWWFAQNGLSMPAADYLNEIAAQLLNAKKDADLNLVMQHLILRKYQQRAYLCEDKPAAAFDLVWDGEPFLDLPSGGRLVFNQVLGKGLSLKLGMTKLRITNRDGGERFKPNPLRPTRTLKYLLQEINMPPWKRQYLPLIYWEDKLACVPGIGIAYGLEASGDEAGLEIIWQE
ncbi:MAG: tRNA lysidine(34) synthetase TilS [Methylotenera sp. 24-45-7]|jgi:tRNA(Ile)-lysidine synthase|nr:MAG: tRNA lysidine(34) synthetase TilS [Methylotenera sp. 24-45-7]OZA09853.1 MAG: tRNA lysidine(34) synthetase TilS [Methylotenera sp. 17-45-7]OZA54386.1 MAG: tRNA lysidine(34) synthetase TilS [Methylophilales bacterium 39-45-7]HQS36827.1 tRNA lysidine(34) synthetase TilS [Methylotenera sp.]HQS43750.1 tRNA lysidine(34) synthetase TilS [Methylotenera sp.]